MVVRLAFQHKILFWIAGMLEDVAQICNFLHPASAKCRDLARKFGIDPDTLSQPLPNPFEVMLDQLVNNKQVTSKQLAKALQSPLVGCSLLALKVLRHFGK